jgi:hypothetical protein
MSNDAATSLECPNCATSFPPQPGALQVCPVCQAQFFVESDDAVEESDDDREAREAVERRLQEQKDKLDERHIRVVQLEKRAAYRARSWSLVAALGRGGATDLAGAELVPRPAGRARSTSHCRAGGRTHAGDGVRRHRGRVGAAVAAVLPAGAGVPARGEVDHAPRAHHAARLLNALQRQPDRRSAPPDERAAFLERLTTKITKGTKKTI